MIYLLDQDPKMTAQYLDDKSLEKMIRDIAQVLCNVHHDLLFDEFNKSSLTEILKINYKLDSIPLKSNEKACLWTQWVLECRANYLYLVELGLCCLNEYNKRFNLNLHMLKQNMINGHPVEWARDNVPDLPVQTYKKDDFGHTVMVCGLFGNKNTPLPLVIPKKYQYYEEHCLKTRKIKYSGIGIYEAYRNYYQDKLNKVDNCECSKCHGMLPYHHNEWTKRQRPEWLNL